jgi:alanine-glyoxylate transaminase / (R)-3-amino-2-methylpropionate-pyruvate transaminase
MASTMTAAVSGGVGPTETPAEYRERLLAGNRDYLYPCETRLYKEPLVLVRGNGARVEAEDGREYLDLFSGILTTSVGHCHPEVVARVQRQVETLGHTSTLYLTENEVEMAKALAAIAPGRLDRTFFTNSGTEAIETAVLLACVHTGRTDIIALRYGYSGRSALATNLTAHAGWRPLTSSLVAVKHALSPYAYRCPFKQPCDETCLEKFTNDLEEVILTTTNGRPAAFLAETIQGVAGYVVPPPGYFQRVAEIIHRYGGLLISDEVQTGFGRTGDRWFGIEHWGVEPDIMVMAKGIANGFPVGATMTRGEIADSWKSKTISTFGGNPVAMAAALATNEIMVRENVPSLAAARGRQLRAGLDSLASEFPWIGDVRGMGLMQAIELVDDPVARTPSPTKAKQLLEAARAEGTLIGIGGLHGHVIRIGPSLLITEDEIEEGLASLGRACRRVGSA